MVWEKEACRVEEQVRAGAEVGQEGVNVDIGSCTRQHSTSGDWRQRRKKEKGVEQRG